MIGRELAEQIPAGDAQLVSPASAGSVLVGAANGLAEAEMVMPVLVAVQAAGCASITKAFSEGARTVMPWSDAVDTKAAAIADRLEGYAQDGTRVIRAVHQSGGLLLLSVTRSSMRPEWHDGVDAEFLACAVWRI